MANVGLFCGCVLVSAMLSLFTVTLVLLVTVDKGLSLHPSPGEVVPLLSQMNGDIFAVYPDEGATGTLYRLDDIEGCLETLETGDVSYDSDSDSDDDDDDECFPNVPVKSVEDIVDREYLWHFSDTLDYHSVFLSSLAPGAVVSAEISVNGSAVRATMYRTESFERWWPDSTEVTVSEGESETVELMQTSRAAGGFGLAAYGEGDTSSVRVLLSIRNQRVVDLDAGDVESCELPCTMSQDDDAAFFVGRPGVRDDGTVSMDGEYWELFWVEERSSWFVLKRGVKALAALLFLTCVMSAPAALCSLAVGRAIRKANADAGVADTPVLPGYVSMMDKDEEPSAPLAAKGDAVFDDPYASTSD